MVKIPDDVKANRIKASGILYKLIYERELSEDYITILWKIYGSLIRYSAFSLGCEKLPDCLYQIDCLDAWRLLISFVSQEEFMFIIQSLYVMPDGSEIPDIYDIHGDGLPDTYYIHGSSLPETCDFCQDL